MKLEKLEIEHYYHIFNRGINGDFIFKNDENKKYFLKLVSKYLNNRISVLAYCLMDNHFHFVIKINEEGTIVTQAFSNLFNAYAKAFNKQNSRTGSLFEKHFKRIKLVNDNYLKQLIIYIHTNPKHHLNMNFEDYMFSSYQSILSQQETKIDRDEVLTLFDDIQNFRFCHKNKNDVLNEKYTFE